MDLSSEQQSLLAGYLDYYAPLIRDRRTATTFRGTITGIIGAQSLICAQIAAFSPSVGRTQPVR